MKNILCWRNDKKQIKNAVSLMRKLFSDLKNGFSLMRQYP